MLGLTLAWYVVPAVLYLLWSHRIDPASVVADFNLHMAVGRSRREHDLPRGRFPFRQPRIGRDATAGRVLDRRGQHREAGPLEQRPSPLHVDRHCHEQDAADVERAMERSVWW